MSSINQCTRCLTGETKLVQYYRLCITCSAVGVCLNCVSICHDGHNLGPLLREKFYCQCHQITHNCRALFNNFGDMMAAPESSSSALPVSSVGAPTTAAASKKRKLSALNTAAASSKAKDEPTPKASKPLLPPNNIFVWIKSESSTGKTFLHSFNNKDEANKEVKKVFIQDNPWQLKESELMFQESFTMTHDDQGFLNMKVDGKNGDYWEVGCEVVDNGNHDTPSEGPKDKKAKKDFSAPAESKKVNNSVPPSKVPSSATNDEDDDDEMVIFADVKPKYEDIEVDSGAVPAADQPKKKGSRPKKEPGMPKGPVASFMMFSNRNREKITQENPGLSMVDISRNIGQQWKSLTAEDKLPYEELARVDKLRYQKEMEEYKVKKAAGELPPVETPAPKPRKAPAKKKDNTSKSEKAATSSPVESTKNEAESEIKNNNSVDADDEEISFAGAGNNSKMVKSTDATDDEEIVEQESTDDLMEIDNHQAGASSKKVEPSQNGDLDEDEEEDEEDKSKRFTVYHQFETEGDDEDSDTHTLKTVPDQKFGNFRQANHRVRQLFFKGNGSNKFNEESMVKENMEEIINDDGLLTLIYRLPNNGGTWRVGVQERGKEI